MRLYPPQAPSPRKSPDSADLGEGADCDASGRFSLLASTACRTRSGSFSTVGSVLPPGASLRPLRTAAAAPPEPGHLLGSCLAVADVASAASTRVEAVASRFARIHPSSSDTTCPAGVSLKCLGPRPAPQERVSATPRPLRSGARSPDRAARSLTWRPAAGRGPPQRAARSHQAAVHPHDRPGPIKKR